MNNTLNSISSALLAAPFQLNIYFGGFLWITGNIGCMGNIIVFRSRTFRKRAYSIYLMTEALSDFIYFNFVLMTRMLQKGYQIPVTARYDPMCKIRQFLSVWGNQISFTCFLFATIDRLMSTQRSNTYRRWSNRTGLAYKICAISICLWSLFYGHRLILYNTINRTCEAQPGPYAIFDAYAEAIFTAICPSLMMIIFSYLLSKSVRGTIQRQIFPINIQVGVPIVSRSSLHQIDSQLTLMLMLQSIIASITYVPYATELIYSSVTQDLPKSALRNAQEKVFTEFTHLLSYTFFASSFYVSMLSNIGYRRKFKKFFNRFKLNIREDRANTAPATNLTPTKYTQ